MHSRRAMHCDHDQCYEPDHLYEQLLPLSLIVISDACTRKDCIQIACCGHADIPFSREQESFLCKGDLLRPPISPASFPLG